MDQLTVSAGGQAPANLSTLLYLRFSFLGLPSLRSYEPSASALLRLEGPLHESSVQASDNADRNSARRAPWQRFTFTRTRSHRASALTFVGRVAICMGTKSIREFLSALTGERSKYLYTRGRFSVQPHDTWELASRGGCDGKSDGTSSQTPVVHCRISCAALRFCIARSKAQSPVLFAFTAFFRSRAFIGPL